MSANFRDALRDRTISPHGKLSKARFFSLRNRNADPVSTAMTLTGRVQMGLAQSEQSPFPEFVEDYKILANHLGIEFSTSCYPYRQIGFRV